MVKKLVKDPDMPNFVKKFIDALIDEILPDVKQEIMTTIFEALRRTVFEDEIKAGEAAIPEFGKLVCFYPFMRARGWFLYHLMPFNKGIWTKLRDPWFLILTIIPLFPLWGVTHIWYMLMFLIIDKRDEFQL